MSVEKIFSYRKESLIPDIDEGTGDSESPKNKLVRLLDDVESRAERFRRSALIMEEEKDLLFSSIDAIKTSELIDDLTETDKEEIMNCTDRITSLCNTVEISVQTVRNEMQEESLNQVNTFIDNLVIDLRGDPCIVKDRCISYMAACTSKADDENVDKKFENAVLGCSLYDQKRIRRRLQGLMSYIDYAFKISSADD